MTTKDIIKLTPKQIERLTTKQLRAYVTQIRNTTVKRTNSIKRAGVKSMALERLKQGGEITISGDRQQLIKSLGRMKQFLQSESGSVAGAKAVEAKTEKGAQQWFDAHGIAGYDKMSADEKSEFWKFLDNSTARHAIERYYGNYRGTEAIKIAMGVWRRSKTKNPQSMAKSFAQQAKKMYEASMDERNAALAKLEKQLYSEV